MERKRMFGVAETERLPPAAYGRDEAARVYAALTAQARRVIAAGHSAIVDGVFADAGERVESAAAAQAENVRFRGLFLTADLASRLARIAARRHDASDATADVVRSQESYDLGALDWTRIDAAGTRAQTLAAARAAVSATPEAKPGCIRGEPPA
jgi:hypothetical protein